MHHKAHGTYRLIHFSDIHFCVFPKLVQCFNKRFKGMLRQCIGGAPFHANCLAIRFPEFISTFHPDGFCISGDLSLTALDQEFSLAKAFIQKLSTQAPIYLLPGNHDVYTKRSWERKVYYQYFPDSILQSERVHLHRLNNHWALVLLDCSYKNGWFSANGLVTPSQIDTLEKQLQHVSMTTQIIIANHFPLCSTNKPYHDLLNCECLQKCIERHPEVRLYLHGHDHHANSQAFGHVQIINSGSVSLTANAQFHIIDLQEGQCCIHRYHITNLTSTEPLTAELCESLFLKTGI